MDEYIIDVVINGKDDKLKTYKELKEKTGG